jgi:Family of unknown function (DUF5691)
MGLQLTANQITAMAPDSSSASAGKKIADPKHWKTLGINEHALWGECQGSALYLVRIALSTFSIRCNCPSRKQPCKHGLGLLLLAVNHSELLTNTEPPEWVTDWLTKQAAAAKRKETLEENKASGIVAVTSPKTVEKRLAHVTAGVAHLDYWLNDLVRNGIGILETQPTTFWESEAARMVDSQAPGLASRLRRMATIPNSSAAWPEKLLQQLGLLALLSEAFQHLDQFEPDFQEEIRQLIGWTVKEDHVAVFGEHVTDNWFFLGQIIEETERGKNQRTWLLGQETGRSALVLQFSYAGTPFAETYTMGIKQKATVAYWTGVHPQRALLHKRTGAIVPVQERLPGHDTCAAFFDEVATILAQCPWRERFLCVLRNVVPLYDPEHNQWWISDQEQQAIPLQNKDHWSLLALSGGHPIDFVGEWNGETLLPLFQYPLTDQVHKENHSSLSTSPDRGNANSTILGVSRSMNKLVTTAIIGTGQQATTDISTETEVDDLTRQLAREQPERTLLLAAGAWALYQEAGYIPQSPQISYQPAPVEEKKACSSKTAQILTDLLHGKHDVLLPEALEKLQQARQRLPHELLPQVLMYGTKNKQLQAALLPVLGARGHWLAQFSHEWDWATAMPTNADFINKPLPDIETLWQEGTLQQRVEILRHVRTMHPDIARDWMISTWKKENVETRTAFIALLEINLSQGDEKFLEQALHDRSEGVRKKAAHLLADIPSSAFNQRMRERADTLLHYAAGELQITPPETFDPIWKHDGITQDGERGAQTSWLLLQVISQVPPSHWEVRFATSPVTLLETINTTGWFEAIVKGWTIAARHYNTTLWFEPLLDWWSKFADRDDKEYITLFHHLPQDRVEQHVLSHLFVGTIWIEELIALPRPWSSSFSRACLETLQQRASELANNSNNYSNYHTATALINTIATALPPDCFEAAITEWTFSTDPEDKNWYVKFWVDQVNNLKTLLRLRKKMLREIL